MKPIHQKGSTNKESNYREISLSSCLAKFFNNLIFKRLTTCSENLNLFHPHIMEFRPRMRTSNNCLVLKTLIDKQFKETERHCLEAFRGLLAKIESCGINRRHESQGGYTSIFLTGMVVREQISTTQKNRMTLNSNPQKIECPKIQTQEIE